MVGRTTLDAVEEVVNSPSGTSPSTLESADSIFTPNKCLQSCADVVDSGVVELWKAAELYRYFREELSPHYPAIFILPSRDVHRIRKESPSLFLSTIATAAASFEPNIAPALNREVEKSHAQRVLIDGERSLDLAQALLVTAIWSYPPASFEKLKFGRHAQMAAEMVMDLDLPRELDQHLSSDGYVSIAYIGSLDALIEKSRTVAACFLLCSG